MSNEKLNSDMAKLSIEPEQDNGWEVIARKSKKVLSASNSISRGSSTLSANAKPWNPSAVHSNAKSGNSSNATSNTKAWDSSTRTNAKGWCSAVSSNASAWGSSTGNSRVKSMGWDVKDNSSGGRNSSYSKTMQTDDVTPPSTVPPPLPHGWQWPARAGSESKKSEEGSEHNADSEPLNIQSDISLEDNDGDDIDDSDDIDDDDDDDIDDDDFVEDSDYDSDASQKSHNTRKNHKWLKTFFDVLDSLTEEQITAPDRQWHCPACHDGPGAIDWYKGLQPLLTHGKTRGTLRVRLHREFAELLEEEVKRRGGSLVPSGEIFGKWRGLQEMVADKDIVWPPMVIVRNTILEKDEKEKWKGMGNQELVDYFSSYAAVKARHSYGPNGHRGLSVLLFEPSPMGYIEAERLHKHFTDEGRDRESWIQKKVLFYPGGKRILYGYLATKEDLEVFNQHSAGKSRLKYEIKSYLEMVVNPMRKMDEDNQKLKWYKHKAVKQEQRCKAYEESFEKVSQKLRETLVDNHNVRLRTKMQQEENKEEMDCQEQFFKEQMEKIHNAIEEKEQVFMKLLQQERAKAKESGNVVGSPDGRKRREEEINEFISSQEKGVEEFVGEREKLIKEHESMKVELKRRYLEEEVKLEKKLDAELSNLMHKFAPITFKSCAGI